MAHQFRVLISLETAGGTRCVDILHRAPGYGWQECRRDPEDGHGWRVIDWEATPLPSYEAALADAKSSVGWLA